MCTLLGWYSTVPVRTPKKLLPYVDARGRDAFGVYVETLGKFVFSSKKDLLQFLHHLPGQRFVSIVSRAIPASERHATDVEKDTQPFTDQNWVVTHNGIIANDETLEKQYSLTRTSKVDTAVVPPLLQKLGIEDTLKALQGSFALTVYKRNTGTLYLATNFMPLYWAVSGAMVMWSSMPIPGFQPLEPYSYLTINKRSDHTFNVVSTRLPTTLDQSRVAVVCSGGMDSVTTLRLYQVLGYSPTIVHFDYGQAASEVEDYCTSRISEIYGIPKLKLEVSQIFKHMKSVLTTAKAADPKYRHWDMESTYSYVGARNLILASLAMGIAEELNIGRLALGLNLDDGGGYPDNNSPFVDTLHQLSAYALNWNHYMYVEAPFVHLTKKEILEVALAIGSPLHLTASCYYPKLEGSQIVYCGQCGCDKLREESFRALGIKDPIPYATNPSWEGCSELEQTDWVRVREPHTRLKLEEIPYHKYLQLRSDLSVVNSFTTS